MSSWWLPVCGCFLLWTRCWGKKYLQTNLILRPQGSLRCPHLHINEKLLHTLETTTTLQCFKKQGSYEKKKKEEEKKKRDDIKIFAFFFLITLISLINEPLLCPGGSFFVFYWLPLNQFKSDFTSTVEQISAASPSGSVEMNYSGGKRAVNISPPPRQQQSRLHVSISCTWV